MSIPFLSKHHYPALEISYLAVKEEHRSQGIRKAIVDSIADSILRFASLRSRACGKEKYVYFCG